MNVNMKLFNAFLLVTECGGLRVAAERANRSLPAISMQIRQLETQIGLPLFHRNRRQLVLTQAGEHLLACTRKAFQEMESGLRQLQQSIDLEHGQVALACSPTIATSILPSVLSQFSQKYPGVHLHLRELSLAEQLDSLKTQEVDFSIGPRPEGSDQAILFEPVMRDDILALLPADHPLARRKSITLRAFIRTPVVMLSRDAGFRRTLDAILLSSNMPPPQIRCEAKQISTLIAIVRAGMGAALLPRVAMNAELQAAPHSGLTVLPLTRPSLSRDIGLLTLRGTQLTPAATQLCEMLRKALQSPATQHASRHQSSPLQQGRGSA